MLRQTYSLKETDKTYFNMNGHVYLPDVLSTDALQPYREAINRWAKDFRAKQKSLAERDTYGKAFLQMMNLWEEDSLIKEFTLAKRFAKIAADLLGVSHVRLYHDQALFKEPGGGLTPWHQDQYYWPLDTTKTVTMWMPLVDIDDDMGMLTFASGTQEVNLPKVHISDESEQMIGQFVKENNFPIVAQKTMKAGDATFHQGWTLHAAPGNHSTKMREVMTIIYMDADAHVIEPQNDNQEADRQRWLQGLAPGSLAASELNPILV
ncbi:phytanoyl-CoA dioxygenase family protein [Aquirufa rosea]|uniref:Phytanoyl-CoA dioxygenase family protein n=1 Tax=Aquirufa rosea TaxID=2509241 RepID=A0A4Q1C1J0_9BACT|nr:phytanoyl-CoA dioxygenase family protein [Aquirufa rosea]RXK50986.1 phytanoyl-CoA dioxygenase family protein [Aquirufa rosea]